jgi:NADH-quinone oxidoreductase subunit L
MASSLALALVVAAPLAGVLIGAALHGSGSKKVHWPILLSSAIAVAASLSLAYAGKSVELPLWAWMTGTVKPLVFSLRADGLTISILWMVCLVSALIHVYAVEYMHDDPSFGRFFLYFHFFFFSMVGLLTSGNYLQMYMFWEGVGLASFLLIGFWYSKESARKAALKAFLVNRVGDMGFLSAALLLWSGAGTLNFGELFGSLGTLEPWRVQLCAFLLIWAACAKSAQFPLHVWLPDAMEGPTPVSALMHAATMVTAGVFLLLRSWPLLVGAPGALTTVTIIGAVTALLGALVASVKTDLKRILAYSTMSHLGLMTMAIGLYAPGAAAYHLVVHGFFKALLFLCAGNVLHAIGKSSASAEDVGGLREYLPGTFWAFIAGAVSLSGVLPLGGFFSKDRIIDAALSGGPLLKITGVSITILSSFYIFRLVFFTFLGKRRSEEPAHPHDAGPAMALPVYLLAAFSLAAGLFAGPVSKLLGMELEPIGTTGAAVGLGCAWTGLILAWIGVEQENSENVYQTTTPSP